MFEGCFLAEYPFHFLNFLVEQEKGKSAVFAEQFALSIDQSGRVDGGYSEYLLDFWQKPFYLSNASFLHVDQIPKIVFVYDFYRILHESIDKALVNLLFVLNGKKFQETINARF